MGTPVNRDLDTDENTQRIGIVETLLRSREKKRRKSKGFPGEGEGLLFWCKGSKMELDDERYDGWWRKNRSERFEDIESIMVYR